MQTFFSNAKHSWLTTAFGIVGGVGIGLYIFLGGDPGSFEEFIKKVAGMIGAISGALGGVSARDGRLTSRDVGAE